MSSNMQERIDASLALINDYVARSRAVAPVDSSLLNYAHDGVAVFSLGGQHLRSNLVHLSAGDVEGEQLQAATVFGACVDLLHGALLIHDDIIDRDDTRRGQPTVHAVVRDSYQDQHLGTSVGITAGDLALNGAIQILVESPLDDALVRAGTRILTAAAQQTIIGEILDISHTVDDTTSHELVRMSNHLKTADYSFGAPLKLGALAAGRDPEPMDPIGVELGRAYQAADDIAGTVGLSGQTGKMAGGDVLHGRATLMTMRMGNDDVDPLALGEIIDDVVQEGLAHLNVAREMIAKADLLPAIHDGLQDMTVRLEGMLRAYA